MSGRQGEDEGPAGVERFLGGAEGCLLDERAAEKRVATRPPTITRASVGGLHSLTEASSSLQPMP